MNSGAPGTDRTTSAPRPSPTRTTYSGTSTPRRARPPKGERQETTVLAAAAEHDRRPRVPLRDRRRAGRLVRVARRSLFAQELRRPVRRRTLGRPGHPGAHHPQGRVAVCGRGSAVDGLGSGRLLHVCRGAGRLPSPATGPAHAGRPRLAAALVRAGGRWPGPRAAVSVRIRFDPGPLKESHFSGHALRFALGGAVTVATGLVAKAFG